MKKLLPLAVLILFISCNSNSKKNKESMSSTTQKEKNLNTVPKEMRNSPLFNTDVVAPTQLFDNLYFAGYKGVGVFIINTSKGILMIDAMWTTNDAKNVLVPSIKKLGLDPHNIKYLIVTHEHADHYGGASYFEDTYGTEILMSKVAWNGMHSNDADVLIDPFGNKSSNLTVPKSYREIKDREIIHLGESSVEVLLTPGHTPGAVSLLINTTINNKPIVVSVWGGTGLPKTKEGNLAYLNSLNYFEEVALEKGVGARISNHPFSNGLLDAMETLRTETNADNHPLLINEQTFKVNLDSNLRKMVKEKLDDFE